MCSSARSDSEEIKAAKAGHAVHEAHGVGKLLLENASDFRAEHLRRAKVLVVKCNEDTVEEDGEWQAVAHVAQ